MILSSCPLTVGKTVDFFQVFPLTHEELEYKIKCAEDEDCESPTDMLLDHIHADREHWLDYALSRFDYREQNSNVYQESTLYSVSESKR